MVGMVGLNKTLHLVRHGATAWSESGRLCGWSDVPLSETGREQANQLRVELTNGEYAGVWTSDLRRASEFAALVISSAVADQRLREIDFGDLEGLSWSECDQATRSALLEFDHFQAPGGESVPDLRRRVVDFVQGLPAGAHLVFTYGGVIRALTRMTGPEQAPPPGSMVSLPWTAS
jgi:probable phosphoglycerate mutase